MISVIIPNYNHEKFLPGRIESVLSQGIADMEVIILDDCSRDNSREVIERYRPNAKVTHIVYNEQNSGSTFKQWKKGLDLAGGEWIWIAESDDVCESNFLETLLDPGIGDDIGLRYCASFPVDANGDRIDEVMYNLGRGTYRGIEFLKQHLMELNRIPNASSVVLKKDLLAELLTPEVLSSKLTGDWLVWCKAALRTNVFYSTATANYHRQHQQTVRDTLFRKGNYYAEFAGFRKHLARNINQLQDEELKKELLQLNRKFHYKEEGLLGCEMIRNKQVFKSVPHILKASFLPSFTIYYFKSAAYWLLRVYGAK